MRRAALPALVLLAGLALVAALYAWGGDGYFALRRAAGLQPFAPFLDLHNVMAAVACWHEGVDVYATNPCDVMGRLHIYSPLWLRLPAVFGLPALTGPIGVGLALAFILALLVLPAPVGRGGMAALVLAVVSPDTVFALERANMDVLIFVAVVLAVPLLARGIAARGVAYAVFLGMGLLKFYPLVLLGLVVRERPRVALGFGVAAVALAALAVLPLGDEFGRAIGNILPHPAFTGTFGSRQLADGLALLLPGHGGVAVAAGVLAAAVVGLAVRLAEVGLAAADGLARREADLLLVGGVLISGCFLAGESVEYRAIFLVLAMPALLRLGGGSRLFIATSWGAVWLLWDPVVRRVVARLAPAQDGIPGPPGLLLWGVRELLWWWVVVVLIVLMAGMLRRAPSIARLGSR